MAAVDEHRQLDRCRPADITQCVERRADRTTGIEHVVDEDHKTAVDAPGGYRGLLQRSGRLEVQVVPVQGDVEPAVGDGSAAEFVDFLGEPIRQRDTASRDTQQDDTRRVGTVQGGFLDDLVGDAGNGSTDVRIGHKFTVGDAQELPGPPSPPLGTDR